MAERIIELYKENGDWAGFQVEDPVTSEVRHVWWGGTRPPRIFTRPPEDRTVARAPQTAVRQGRRAAPPVERPLLRVVMDEHGGVPPPPDTINEAIRLQKARGERGHQCAGPGV